MFGAHWDHLGIALPVNGDNIYNGAIDNGTGVGGGAGAGRVHGEAHATSRAARRCLRSGPPRRAGCAAPSIIAAHPLVPAAKIAVNINYDAIFPSARTRTSW